MIALLNLETPLTEPVLIIALILLILLIGPVFFERIRIPSIAGLLLMGAFIGPHGINLVSPDLEFSLLGTFGLLYLLFLAGLEIDLVDFIENKTKSIFIGLASFLIPFLLGFVVSRYLLSYGIPGSWLIGAMLATHTLISYPILGRLGIINKSIVTVTVGATIIADILALLSMEVITDFASRGVHLDNLLFFFLKLAILFVVIFLVGPRISRFFLGKYEGEMGIQYIFVLVILFFSAGIAHLLDIEPIIGAFLSGLVLNRQIINSSPLYKRIEFVGNNLFIPFFLISIGILANFRVYIDQPRQILFLIILIVIAFLTKYLAAWISKLVFRFSKSETNLLYGLSLARAASGIAIILIGFNSDLVSETVLNNTVILILVTSIASSYITLKAGKGIQLKENDTISTDQGIKQKILVSVANPANMQHLLDFAILIKKEDEGIPVYPLTIFSQGKEVREEINANQEKINKVISSLHTDINFETSSRISENITNGIVRAAEELVATTIVMGWHKHSSTFQLLFGDILKNLLKKTRRMVLVLKTPSNFRQVTRVQLICTENAEFEEGFSLWMDTLIYFTRKMLIKIIVYSGSERTKTAILKYSDQHHASKYFQAGKEKSGEEGRPVLKESSSDLLIFVNSRKKYFSYSRKFQVYMNKTITSHEKNNVVIIYPEQ